MGTLASLDLAEVRCRQLMGQPVSIPSAGVAESVQGPSADETETVEDTW